MEYDKPEGHADKHAAHSNMILLAFNVLTQQTWGYSNTMCNRHGVTVTQRVTDMEVTVTHITYMGKV